MSNKATKESIGDMYAVVSNLGDHLKPNDCFVIADGNNGKNSKHQSKKKQSSKASLNSKRTTVNKVGVSIKHSATVHNSPNVNVSKGNQGGTSSSKLSSTKIANGVGKNSSDEDYVLKGGDKKPSMLDVILSIVKKLFN